MLWKQYQKIHSVQTTEVVQVQYSATPRLNIWPDIDS